MADRPGFILSHDLLDPLRAITDEQRGRILLAAFDYSERGVIPPFGEPEMRVAFACVKASIDKGAASWDEEQQRRSEAGKAGAEARWGKKRR